MLVKLENGAPSQWPVPEMSARLSSPSVSLPQSLTPEVLEPLGYGIFIYADPPAFNALVEKVEERPPVKQGDTWVQQWEAVQLYNPAEREQVLADAAAKEAESAALALQQSIIDATQNRLDSFARTRSYDGILSACTYATSAVPKFRTEGQYCVEARDATWAKLYSIIEEVNQGIRPMPTGFSDIELELPVLIWP